jgi:hypothetical protein
LFSHQKIRTKLQYLDDLNRIEFLIIEKIDDQLFHQSEFAFLLLLMHKQNLFLCLEQNKHLQIFLYQAFYQV